FFFFFFSSRRRHTRCLSDWSSDVCSSDLRAARSWLLAASWSCDSWSRPADAAYFSVPAPMAHWSKAQKRPSYIIESTTVWSPMRSEERRVGKESRDQRRTEGKRKRQDSK